MKWRSGTLLYNLGFLMGVLAGTLLASSPWLSLVLAAPLLMIGITLLRK
jgi:hypothetical protein